MPPIRCIPLAPTVVRRRSSTHECLPTSWPRDLDDGLRAYEEIRRAETADVVAANREMHVTGATQRPEDLARVTGKYREDTEADKVRR